MFHPDVPKYLNYIIHILACSCETSVSHSNSDTFLQTVLEPRKARFWKCETNFNSNPVQSY